MNSLSFRLIVALVVVQSFVCSHFVWAHDFVFENPEPATDVGFNDTGVAINGAGNPGLCFPDAGKLKYTTRENGAWRTETADEAAGKSLGLHCALVFDALNRPHILHFDVTTGRLLHASRENGVWVRRVADGNIFTDFFADSRISVALSPAGELGVAYYDGIARDLRYAAFDGAVWQAEVVLAAGSVGHFPSLAFDSNGNPVIAYAEMDGSGKAALKMIRAGRNGWQAPETIRDADNAGRYAALALDHNGTAHVTYMVTDDAGIQSLVYANNGDGAWSAPIVIGQANTAGVSGGMGNVIVAGPNGDIHALFTEDFASALFGQFRSVKLTSLYFTDRRDASLIVTTTQRIAGNADRTAYNGLALAVDGAANLVAVYADEDWNDDFILTVATLAAWTPAIRLLTPQGGVVGQDDQIDVSWLDFDPDGVAAIDFYTLNEGFVSAAIGGRERSAGEGATRFAVGNLDAGNYFIAARISGDNFVNYASSFSAARVSVTPRAAPVVAPLNNAPQILPQVAPQDIAPQVVPNAGPQPAAVQNAAAQPAAPVVSDAANDAVAPEPEAASAPEAPAVENEVADAVEQAPAVATATEADEGEDTTIAGGQPQNGAAGFAASAPAGCSLIESQEMLFVPESNVLLIMAVIVIGGLLWVRA